MKMRCMVVLMALLGAAGCGFAQTPRLNMLTPEEERVIVGKGTEAPFSGKYDRFDGKGMYVCKRCGAPLYRSESKFDAGCGWPSFDDTMPGAVRAQRDADGERMEITCAQCGAHLGHVFMGEGLTLKNTRHCVNSISMNFVPDTEVSEQASIDASGMEHAVFAGGCFWGVEYYLRRAPGVTGTRVGYVGGKKRNPTYEEVCRGNTGHAEAVEVVFDRTKTSYENLARLFFEIHDPTQVNGQGPDIGPQYRSAVFYLSDEQKAVAEKLIQLLKEKGYPVATQVKPAGIFWPAEDYHQNYYDLKGGVPYCHGFTKRF